MADERGISINDHLERLLDAYGALGGARGVERLENYRLAARGRPVALVARTVDEFLAGKVDRKKGLRGKPPTSDEFGGHLRTLEKVVELTGQRGEMEYAPPFGPLWGLKLYDRLKDGPDAVLPRPPAFVRKMIEQGGEVGARYALHHQAVAGFGAVNAMMAGASFGKGCYVELALKVHIDRMEPVPIVGETFKAWRAEHEVRGWPWFPDAGSQRVIYLPASGPAGLDDLLTELAAKPA